jgi:type IX secretion system PorP/SprF family membrane protein
MKNIITVFLVMGGIVLSSSVFAQQDPMFTQSFDNMIYVNPAYAGSRGMLNFTDLNRIQWVGFDGNPRSNALSINSPIFNESLGAGLNVISDAVGPIKQTMVFADLAYSIKVNNKGARLAFGIKGGFNLLNVNSSNLTTTDIDDPLLVQNIQNNVNANFGTGIFYHSPKFYAGISTPKILKQSYDGVSTTNLEKRHYFGIIGGVTTLSKDWKLKPTAQVRFTEGSPLNVDLSLATIYRDKLWLGTLYRLDAAYGVFVQFQFSPQLKVGIASDFDASEVRGYNTGSYEIMLSYDLNFKKEGVRSPRYF